MQENVASNGYNIATGSRSAVNTWKPEGDQQQDLKATFMLRALHFQDGSYNLTPKRILHRHGCAHVRRHVHLL